MSEKLNRLKAERVLIQDKWIAARKKLNENPNSYPLRQRVEQLRAKVERNANAITIEEGIISRKSKK